MGSVRDSKRTQKKIIDTAMIFFAKNGFDGVSVDLIAKEAGINKAMIYYYFKNKAKLYEKVITVVLDEIYEKVENDIKDEKRPKDELKVFIYTFSKFAWENPYLPALMLAELGNGAKNLPDDMFVGLKKIFALLGDILQRGEKKGCFSDVKPIIIHFMITGTINLFVSTRELRQRVADEFGHDVCNECDIEEFSMYLYEKIVKMLKKEK